MTTTLAKRLEDVILHYVAESEEHGEPSESADELWESDVAPMLAEVTAMESERDRAKPELAAFLLDETAAHRDRLIEEVERLQNRIAELEHPMSYIPPGEDRCRALLAIARARIAELESKRPAESVDDFVERVRGLASQYLAHAIEVREEGLIGRIAELESRRPVVCSSCRGDATGHVTTPTLGWIPYGRCPDCGKDGAGAGVRWEVTR